MKAWRLDDDDGDGDGDGELSSELCEEEREREERDLVRRKNDGSDGLTMW